MIEEIKKLKLELININRKLYEQAQDIDGNKQGIVENKEAIVENIEAIEGNKQDIDGNKQGILENKEAIDENKQGIDGNKQFIVSEYITVFISQIDRFYIEKGANSAHRYCIVFSSKS